MRRIKQMFNKDDSRHSTLMHPRNSLLNVPNTYDDEIIQSGPTNSVYGQSFRNISTMSGIEEENSDENEEKRRDGVLIRPSVPSGNTSGNNIGNQTELNNDSGYDEK